MFVYVYIYLLDGMLFYKCKFESDDLRRVLMVLK